MNKAHISQANLQRMLLKRSGALVILLIFGGLLVGCNLPGMTAPQPAGPEVDDVGTAVKLTFIAATVSAEQTRVAALQNPPDQQPVPGQQEPPTATLTPQIGDTPSLTLSPTETPTPSIPRVSVSEPTNCRVGPGQPYELIGALMVGEETEIIAKDPTGLYWYVRNPDRDGYCWLWGYYATTAGNTASLPVFTPPPTPTFTPTPTPEPNFTVKYNQIENCVTWQVEFEISNTGGAMFRSVATTVKDNDTNDTVNADANQFDELNGCAVVNTYNDLDPGDTGYTASAAFNHDPTGHNMSATVKVCTEPGLVGNCISKSFNFVP